MVPVMAVRKVAGDEVALDVRCGACGKTYTLRVGAADYVRYLRRAELIQDVFPYLAAPLRELLVSGACPRCRRELFGAGDGEGDGACAEARADRPRGGGEKTPAHQPPDLLAAARARIAELCARHRITMPTVSLDLRGCSAGRAAPRENHMRLNAVLFRENYEDFLAHTIPHELCHLWHHQRGLRGRPHGREWQLLMLQMGVCPERTHRYDVSRARVRRRQKYAYRCGCGTHEVGAVVHHRLGRGKRYRCRRCGQPLTRQVEADAGAPSGILGEDPDL